MQSLFGQMQSQMCSSAQLYSTITFCLLDFRRPQCYTVAVRIAFLIRVFLRAAFPMAVGKRLICLPEKTHLQIRVG